MKKFFTISLTALFLSFFCLSANARPGFGGQSDDEIYFWQESNCLTKCVYECTGASKGLHAFTDYQLTVGATERIVFRVYDSPERKPAFMTTPPAGVRNCSGKEHIDGALAQDVNKGSVALYLVEKTNRGCWVRRVDEVLRIQEQGGAIKYEGPTMAFEYNPSFQYDLGHDLRPDREKGGMLFYIGSDIVQCNQQYGFRSYDADYNAYTDVAVVPGIGLYSMLRGGQKLQLTYINDWPAATHIALECAKQTADKQVEQAPLQPKEYEMASVPTTTNKSGFPLGASNPSAGSKPLQVIKLTPAAKVPAAGAAPQSAAAPLAQAEAGGYHTVVTGESLYQISQRYNISMKRLRELNGLKDNTIYMLQKIKVVDDEPVVPTSYEMSKRAPRKHVVKKGDNLYRLSLKYNTTVEKLIALNQLNTIALEVEQELIIDDFATATR